MRASIIEAKTGSGDEFSNCASDEDFSRGRLAPYPRTYMNGDPTHLLPFPFHLPHMYSAAHFKSQSLEYRPNRPRATDRCSGALEGCQESIARKVELETAEATDLSADPGMMLPEELIPGLVAEFSGSLR
jgi:hypothetical protein